MRSLHKKMTQTGMTGPQRATHGTASLMRTLSSLTDGKVLLQLLLQVLLQLLLQVLLQLLLQVLLQFLLQVLFQLLLQEVTQAQATQVKRKGTHSPPLGT